MNIWLKENDLKDLYPKHAHEINNSIAFISRKYAAILSDPVAALVKWKELAKKATEEAVNNQFFASVKDGLFWASVSIIDTQKCMCVSIGIVSEFAFVDL